MTHLRLSVAVRSKDAETKMWKGRFCAARIAYVTGELRQCENLLTRALDLARGLDERDFALNSCLVGLGAACLAQEKLEDAEVYLQAAVIALSGQCNPALRELCAVALRFYANVAAESGDMDGAHIQLQLAIKVLEGLGLDGRFQLSYTMSDLGSWHANVGDLRRASESIQSALALLRTSSAQDDTEYARDSIIYATCDSKTENEAVMEVERSLMKIRFQRLQHPNLLKAVRLYLRKLYEYGDLESLAQAEQELSMASDR